jgi:hypothetical protein
MKLGALLKWGVFNKGECFRKGDQRSFAVRRFYNSYENLIKLPTSVWGGGWGGGSTKPYLIKSRIVFFQASLE